MKTTVPLRAALLPTLVKAALGGALLVVSLAGMPARAEDPPPDCDPLFGECSGGSTGGQGAYNRLTSYVSGKVINDVWPNRIELTFDTASGAFFSWPSAANFAVRKPGTPNTAASDYRIASVSAAYPVFTLTLADYDPADPSTHIANVDATTLTLAITSGQICGVVNFECYPNSSYGQTPEAISAAQSDTAAPTLAAADIVVDNRSSPHRLTVTFSEPMAASAAADKTQWTLKSNDGALTYQIAAVAFTNGYKSVVLSLPAADVADPTTYLTNAAVQAHLKVSPPTTADPAGNVYAGGTVTEAGATHQLDATAPAFNTAAIDAGNTTLTLTFSKTLLNALADTAALKSAISYAADGSNFAALAAGDGVALNGSTLSVTFAAPLTGSTGKLKIAANSLKDFAGNLQDSAVTSGAIVTHDITAPAYQGATLNAGFNVVALTFDEALVNALADLTALKGAITLATDGTNYAALAAGDSVALDGNTLTVTLAAPLGGASNKIRIAADSLKDAAGNRVGSLTTSALEGRDTTPAAFAFTATTGVALNAPVESAPITVSGINTAALISISGGSYSINGGTYTSASATVNNGDAVTVKVTSAGAFSTQRSATLSIGGVSATFSATTLAEDTTPAAFAFTAATGVALNAPVESAPITVGGINTAAPISISGGSYSINGGTYTNAPGTVNDGDSVKVRVTAAASHASATDATLTIGAVSATFTVTTVAAPVSAAPVNDTPAAPAAPAITQIEARPGAITTLGGTLPVVAAPGSTLEVPPGAPLSGARIELPSTPGGQPVTLKIGGHTLQLNSSGAPATLTFRKVTIDGVETPVLAISSGSVAVTAPPGQPLLAVGGALVSAGPQGGAVNSSVDAGGRTYLAVSGGYVILPRNAFAGGNGFSAIKDGKLYAGEVAVLDAQGKVSGVRLGSLDGQGGLLGDPLPGLARVKLTGKATRISSEREYGEALAALLGKDYASLGQNSNGVLRVTLPGGRLNVLPVGDLVVDTDRADGVTIRADGLAEIALNGVVATFAPALASDAALKAALPSGTLIETGATGVLAINSNGARLWMRPDWLATTDGSYRYGRVGDIALSDGEDQYLLISCFADFAALATALGEEIPGATARANTDGSVTVTHPGGSFIMETVGRQARPSSDALDHLFHGKRWWQEAWGTLFLNVGGALQEFRVR